MWVNGGSNNDDTLYHKPGQLKTPRRMKRKTSIEPLFYLKKNVLLRVSVGVEGLSLL